MTRASWPAQWHQLFDRVTPGCTYAYWTDKDVEQKKQILKDLRQQGELVDYTDQELLTLNLDSRSLHIRQPRHETVQRSSPLRQRDQAAYRCAISCAGWDVYALRSAEVKVGDWR
jgi:hypothetical protein